MCDSELSPERIIELLQLTPHPTEGGFYRETYRSPEKIPVSALPQRFNQEKSFATAIYYLLALGTVSPLHRLPTDELFHFYLGDPVTMLQLHPNGSSELLTLGNDLEQGQRPQVIVPGASWQGAFLNQGGRFALLGTTVSPGFDFSDYQAGSRDQLLQQYPGQRELIIRLTPPSRGKNL